MAIFKKGLLKFPLISFRILILVGYEIDHFTAIVISCIQVKYVGSL